MDKIKEFIFRVKILLALVFIMIAIISGIVSTCWPKTKFDYPFLAAVISAIIAGIILRSL